jgi:Uma2 family endonuclease
MNVALRKPMTLEQFLAWEERQPLRYEFDGFRPVAMTGGTAAHAAIQRNLLFSLTGRLRGQRCQPYGSELKIQVAGRIRYPDAFVVCSPVAPRATVVSDPVVVFEVLSESTSSDDLVVKNAEYRETVSIQRYVVLHQTSVAAIIFSRRSGEWATDLVAGDNAVLQMPEIGIEIPLAEIYADVALVPGDDDTAPEDEAERGE